MLPGSVSTNLTGLLRDRTNIFWIKKLKFIRHRCWKYRNFRKHP